MGKTLRYVLAAVALSVLVLGSLTLVSPITRAGDNPCDPVYGMLKWCKDNHGRWDNNCCCCRFH